MNYFDTCSLFDKKLLDYNAIRNFISNLFMKFELPNRKIWSEKQYCLYQKFVIDHKNCGLYLRLGFEQKND